MATAQRGDWIAHHKMDKLKTEITEMGADVMIVLTGYADTHRGMLWQVSVVVDGAAYEHRPHLFIANYLQVLVEDFWRDRPGTEARARFVLSGGLYEQLNLEGEGF